MPALSESSLDRARSGLAGFWRWWTSELAQLLPLIRLPLPGRGNAAADIRPHRDRVEIIRFADGAGERLVERTPLDELGPESWTEMVELTSGRNTRILLAPPLVHVLKLTLPKAARARLRTAIPLQLRDVSPVDPTQLTWQIVDVTPAQENIVVRVVIARTMLLDRFVEGISGQTDRVPPIFAEVEDRPILLRSRSGGGPSLPMPWIVAAGILLSTPLWALLALSILVAAKRSDVAELEQEVAPKIAIERTLRERHDTARALAEILKRPTLTGLIADLAGRLPETATAHDLAMAPDGTLSMALEAPDPDTLRPILAADSRIADLRESDQSATNDGRILIHYQGRLR